MATLSMKQCQQRLALLWFVLGGMAILIAIIQLAGKHWGENENDYAQRMFQWLLPAVIPTMSLILGTLATPLGKKRDADSFFFWLAMGISATYLLIILGLMLFNIKASDMMRMIDLSVWWIGPLQGLVSAAMGYFFFKEKKEVEAAEL